MLKNTIKTSASLQMIRFSLIPRHRVKKGTLRKKKETGHVLSMATRLEGWEGTQQKVGPEEQFR